MNGPAKSGQLLAAYVLMLAMVLTGCDQGTRRQAQSSTDDALLAAQIRARAAAVDPASITLVHVSVDNGVVTLTGTIASMQERDAIETTARATGGVKDVQDKIVVDRSAPTGAQIEDDLTLSTKIHAALVAQTGVNAARIHVDVHRGVVTLSGSLPSAAHRAVAEETARGVTGVTKLIDDITIAR